MIVICKKNLTNHQSSNKDELRLKCGEEYLLKDDEYIYNLSDLDSIIYRIFTLDYYSPYFYSIEESRQIRIDRICN